MIRDLSSTNGTVLNGLRCTASAVASLEGRGQGRTLSIVFTGVYAARSTRYRSSGLRGGSPCRRRSRQAEATLDGLLTGGG